MDNIHSKKVKDTFVYMDKMRVCGEEEEEHNQNLKH